MKHTGRGEEASVNAEIQDLREKCLQMEIDNRELAKHLKTIMDNT